MRLNLLPERGFPEIVGCSDALRELLRAIELVAPTDSTVLIEGETGTGKELVAQAIQRLSLREAAPFVKVNCAAIPHSLLESELMGHERGAFTGALSKRVGRFELAAGGTIFLDEIGEMPLDLQPKLLRVLQEHEFERLGGTKTVDCDVRVIAATNRDLQRSTQERTFREDLYYRLSVFPVTVPPLRERRGDVPLLVQHFATRFAAAMKKHIVEIDPASLERLAEYDWPGNVRQLQNVVERAVILSHQPTLHIALPNRSSPCLSPTRSPDGFAAVSRAHILRVLDETNWVVAGPSGAAARLEMKRSTLIFRMKKLGLVRGQSSGPGHCP
jgi:transcriptional regulator with GAF, ATPase, and Fis domain